VPSPAGAQTSSSSQALAQVHALFDDVRCDDVLRALPGVYASEGLTDAEKLDASFVEVSCLITVGNLTDASQLLSALVEKDPDVQPPFDVEQRVKVLLYATQQAELKKRADAEAARLAELRKSIVLEAKPTLSLKGGQRAVFDVALNDPNGVVTSVSVFFRTTAKGAFYSARARAEGRQAAR
jgi:hypothetical protein